MILDLKDIYLPFIFIEIIIGFQISIYFFYTYYKQREEKINPNKILLAYGLLFGFGISGICIRTFNTYFKGLGW